MRNILILLLAVNFVSLSSQAFLDDYYLTPFQEHNINDLLPEFCLINTYSSANEYRFYEGTSAFCLNAEPLSLKVTTGAFIIPFFWNWGEVSELTEEFIEKNNLEKTAEITVNKNNFEIYLTPKSKIRNFCIVTESEEQSNFDTEKLQYSVTLACTNGNYMNFNLNGGKSALVAMMEELSYVLLPDLNSPKKSDYVIFGEFDNY